MLQSKHLTFRYCQRVLGLDGAVQINKYIEDNELRLYRDIDLMFHQSKKIVENWATFRNHERSDYYLFKHLYLFAVDTHTQEGRTVIKICDDSKIVKQAMHKLTLFDDQLRKLDRLKRDLDSNTRALEWTMNHYGYNELKSDIEANVEKARSLVVQIKEMKQQKHELVYGIAVDPIHLLTQL